MSSKPPFPFSPSPATPSRKNRTSTAAPTTTPAGPPPTYLTNVSTTPAGEPPPRSSKIFGSSYNPAADTFGHRNTPGRRGQAFAVPESSPPYDETVVSTIEDSPRGLKRSRNGDVLAMAGIARSMVRSTGPAQRTDEADDVVLGTEDFLSELDRAAPSRTARKEDAVTDAATLLEGLWAQHSEVGTLPGAIGPELDEPFLKATYIAALLFQLHHPHTRHRSQQVPLPKALLEWLNTYHTPLPDDFNQVHLFRPSPSAHEAYWDILGADLVRGRFSRVALLLRDAGWENAATAADDYKNDHARGYRPQHCANIEEAVERCIDILQQCPVVTDSDWDITGQDWSLFRQKVRSALRELENFATATNEDDDEDLPTRPNMFSRGGGDSIASATARAESRLPPTIYTSLRAIYNVLLGGTEILDYTQDWLESAVLLTVWWDGSDSTALDASTRTSLRATPSRRPQVDLPAYRRRLGQMFQLVPQEVDEPNFQPETLDPVHVALGTVFEDDVAETIALLRTWSPVVAAAVVEVAAVGGWLPGRRAALLGKGFSSEDLMILSHGPGSREDEGVDRDDVLISYAELLAQREKFVSADGRVEREGWEVAVSVLGRLEDGEAARERIRDILETMEVEDEARVEKVLSLCANMGLGELSRGTAERFADSLLSHHPVPYGKSLFYHSLSHSSAKLRATLSHLLTTSLLHSAAMPPTSNLDEDLSGLLSPGRPALVDLARRDSEAAGMLAREMSGYALLRSFYSLRDKGRDRRKVERTLLALVRSAADCIRGGLFDPEVEAASPVPVSGLLVLLGETLPLLGCGGRVWEARELVEMMGVVEDYSAVSSRIREDGEGLFKASMACYGQSQSKAKGKGGRRKGGESLEESWEALAESSWDMLRSGESSEGKEKSRVDVERGWDWRKGIHAAGEMGGKEILGMVRVGLGVEMGRVWSAGGRS